MQICSGTINVITDRVIQAHRLNLALVNKPNKKISFIAVAVPWDSRAEQKEQETEINTKTYELRSGDYGITQWK